MGVCSGARKNGGGVMPRGPCGNWAPAGTPSRILDLWRRAAEAACCSLRVRTHDRQRAIVVDSLPLESDAP
eukprot:6063455-Alexandrium_andersonii.AAC.1